MTNSNELHQQELAMTKKVAEGILGELRKEISEHEQSQMESTIQGVAVRIAEGLNRMDQELEQSIDNAKKTFEGLPQKFLDNQLKVLSDSDQPVRNSLIDFEMSNISLASKKYNIPVDIMKLKESILQLVRKK